MNKNSIYLFLFLLYIVNSNVCFCQRSETSKYQYDFESFNSFKIINNKKELIDSIIIQKDSSGNLLSIMYNDDIWNNCEISYEENTKALIWKDNLGTIVYKLKIHYLEDQVIEVEEFAPLKKVMTIIDFKDTSNNIYKLYDCQNKILLSCDSFKILPTHLLENYKYRKINYLHSKGKIEKQIFLSENGINFDLFYTEEKSKKERTAKLFDIYQGKKKISYSIKEKYDNRGNLIQSDYSFSNDPDKVSYSIIYEYNLKNKLVKSFRILNGESVPFEKYEYLNDTILLSKLNYNNGEPYLLEYFCYDTILRVVEKGLILFKTGIIKIVKFKYKGNLLWSISYFDSQYTIYKVEELEYKEGYLIGYKRNENHKENSFIIEYDEFNRPIKKRKILQNGIEWIQEYSY